MSRLPHSKPIASRAHAPRSASGTSERRSLLLIFLLLPAVIWIVFGQTLHHEFLNFDDDVYVTENAHVESGLTRPGVRWAFGDLSAGFWHPLTWLSLMTDAQLHGMKPAGFHLTNVLL